MNILAFESSCDETSASIVRIDESQRRILSNIIASQIDIHKLYGGVVPEIASRAHTEAISKITYQALSEANLSIEDVDAIAVTYTPGLIGALLVAVNFAKSLAFSYNKPLIPVNHIYGHIAANYLCHNELEPPFVALVASGGHTSLVHVHDYTNIETIGVTRDDAIGESFDKVARVIGLAYPGGAEMDKLASIGDKHAISFPSAAISGGTYDFSFSGLKTAVINYIHNEAQKGNTISHEDLAASFTFAVCKSVTKRLEQIIKDTKTKQIVLAGGVAANSHLRKDVSDLCEKYKIKLFVPDIKMCGDNAAMIGAQGYYEYLAGNIGDESLNAYATKRIQSIGGKK